MHLSFSGRNDINVTTPTASPHLPYAAARLSFYYELLGLKCDSMAVKHYHVSLLSIRAACSDFADL